MIFLSCVSDPDVSRGSDSDIDVKNYEFGSGFGFS